MNKLAIGSAQFGLDYGISNDNGIVKSAEVKNILTAATSLGIDTIDTAHSYGISEHVLGKIGIGSFKIITKTSEIEKGIDIVKRNFYQSLKNLKINQIDGLLVHNFSDVFDSNFSSLYNWLIEIKSQKIVKKIGFSIYDPQDVNFLLKNFDFDIVQTPLNIIDRRLLHYDLLNLLSKNSVEVHIRSIFLQGLLLIPHKALPSKFRLWDKLWIHWESWLKENNLSPIEGCLSFIRDIDGLSRVVLGFHNSAQLKETNNFLNLKNSKVSFPDDLCSFDENLIHPFNWSKL